MNPIHPSLFSRLRALPRPAWILFLGTFLNKFGTFVLPFLTLYLTRRGFTLADAGIAMSAYGVGSLMASGLGGHLADTIGRRKTIVLSMFSVALAMVLLSQSRSLPAIVAATWFAAMTGELYRPASSALLADLVPPELRVTAFSAYRMAFNAGFAFGPATAGFLAERGYFWLFAGDAATSVLFGVIALALLPRGVQGRREEAGWIADLKTLTGDREFHRVLAGAFLIALVFLQVSCTFSLHVTSLGFSTATYGLILSLNGVLVTFCELPLTSLTGRFPPWRMMALGYLLIAAGFAGNAFAHTVPELLGCVVIFTFGEMATFPVSSAYIAGLAPAHLRGRYMGVYALVWSAGLIAAPQMGLRLFAVGPKTLWLTCGALGVIAAAIAFRGPVKSNNRALVERREERVIKSRS
ncbi:MAG TPA: MFS transporter [Candidatus Baltobacteraceae bacterium]|jgi:MFS family permease|nr:MFS transporter [Candidatus Baltobacteraceae bacterium]